MTRLKVWFDEWVLKPGDSIPAKIEEGLEHSRVLVLCMSAHAFGSDWALVVRLPFRSPAGRKRIAQRFIAGFPGDRVTSPARDERDDRQLAQRFLSPLRGLDGFVDRCPSDESLGYFRSSLRDSPQAKIDKALAPGGKGKVFCPDCGKPILLRDVIEEKFESPAVKEQVREMQSEGQAVIDNESRELLAVHHTGFIVAEAGQIYRGYTNSDHGIDGEIEFKDDRRAAPQGSVSTCS